MTAGIPESRAGASIRLRPSLPFVARPSERSMTHATRGGQSGEYCAEHAHDDLNHGLPSFFFHDN